MSHSATLVTVLTTPVVSRIEAKFLINSEHLIPGLLFFFFFFLRGSSAAALRKCSQTAVSFSLFDKIK